MNMVASKLYLLTLVAAFFGASMANKHTGFMDELKDITLKDAIVRAGNIENMLDRALPDLDIDGNLECNQVLDFNTLKTPSLQLPLKLFRQQSMSKSTNSPRFTDYETEVLKCVAKNAKLTYFRPSEFLSEKEKTEIEENNKNDKTARDKALFSKPALPESDVEVLLVKFAIEFNGDSDKHDDYFFQAYDLHTARKLAIISLKGEVSGIIIENGLPKKYNIDASKQ